jgi:hypothetical protein
MVTVAFALPFELPLSALEGEIDCRAQRLTFTRGDESASACDGHVCLGATLLSILLQVNVGVGGATLELGQTLEPFLRMTANGVWNRTMSSGEADVHASLRYFGLARATSVKKASTSSAARSQV